MILPTLALTLKGGGRNADMVIGLDLAFLSEAEKNFSWKKMHFKKSPEDPFDFQTFKKELFPHLKSFVEEGALFQVYDWAPLSFIVRKPSFAKQKILHSWQHWEELLQPAVRGKLALQDPRTSAPGMQFYLWFLATQSDEKEKKEEKEKKKETNLYPSSPPVEFYA